MQIHSHVAPSVASPTRARSGAAPAPTASPAPPASGASEAVAFSDSVNLGAVSSVMGASNGGTLASLVATAEASVGALAGQAAGAAAGPLAAQAIFEGLKTGFVKDYVDPAATLQQCKELAAKYPDLVELVELPFQSHGYDGKRTDLQGPASFYYMRLGPKSEDRDSKVGIYQHAAPHAREHVNPMTMLELAEQLCANYDPASTDPAVVANTQLMDKLDIFISPQTNPDGANYSFYDDKGWRKNRAPHDGVDLGVDINRNYPYKWTGSKRPDYQTYPGKGPASEPETRALIEVVDRHPNIKFVIDWHSHGEEVRRPLGVSKADESVYAEFHGRMSDAIATSRGHKYGVVVSNVVEGSSDDYWYHDRGIYSTVIETARSFQPVKDEALKVMTECARGAREALDFAADFADKQAGSDRSAPAVA